MRAPSWCGATIRLKRGARRAAEKAATAVPTFGAYALALFDRAML
jgi:hypothetical protein